MDVDAMRNSGWLNRNECAPSDKKIVVFREGPVSCLFVDGSWRVNGVGDEVQFVWWQPETPTTVDDSLISRRSRQAKPSS